MKYDIGDILKDEDENLGHVVINWDEGVSPIENNAAHPNPTIIGQWPDALLTSRAADSCTKTKCFWLPTDKNKTCGLTGCRHYPHVR